MKRLTQKQPDGTFATQADGQAVISKLASYEDAHEAVLAEYDRVCKEIDDRKAQGKMKGVMANQLIAQKLSLQNVLSYFKRFGVD